MAVGVPRTVTLTVRVVGMPPPPPFTLLSHLGLITLTFTTDTVADVILAVFTKDPPVPAPPIPTLLCGIGVAAADVGAHVRKYKTSCITLRTGVSFIPVYLYLALHWGFGIVKAVERTALITQLYACYRHARCWIPTALAGAFSPTCATPIACAATPMAAFEVARVQLYHVFVVSPTHLSSVGT